MKIYIVEDEMIVAVSMQLKLAEFGFDDTRLFPSGEEALTEVEAAPPELLIMDVNLIGPLDGIETVDRIRKRFGGVPVIFLTGYSDADVRSKAEQFNPLGYFVKPADIDELHQLIRQEFGPARS